MRRLLFVKFPTALEGSTGLRHSIKMSRLCRWCRPPFRLTSIWLDNTPHPASKYLIDNHLTNRNRRRIYHLTCDWWGGPERTWMATCIVRRLPKTVATLRFPTRGKSFNSCLSSFRFYILPAKFVGSNVGTWRGFRKIINRLTLRQTKLTVERK